MNYNNLKRRLTSAVLAGIVSTALIGCASASENENPDVSEPTAVVEVSEPLVTEKPEIVKVKSNVVISEEDIKTRADEICNKLTSPEAIELVSNNCSEEKIESYKNNINSQYLHSVIELFIITANAENLRETNPELLDKLISENAYFQKYPTLACSIVAIQIYNQAICNSTGKIYGENSISTADLLFDDELKNIVKTIETQIDILYPELKDYCGFEYYPNGVDIQLIYPANPYLNEKISETLDVLDNNVPKLPGGLQYIVYSEIQKNINGNLFYEYLLIDNAKKLLSYGPIESADDFQQYYDEVGNDVYPLNTTAIPYAKIGIEPFEAVFPTNELNNVETQIQHGEIVDKTKDMYCYLTQRNYPDLNNIRHDGHTLCLPYYQFRFVALN